MDWILVLKLVHVISAIVAVGANVTYTFWLRRAGRDQERLVWAIAGVRRLDSTIANPAYVLLLITGVLMVVGGYFSFQTSWIVAALILYVGLVIVGGVLYSPALRRQLDAAEVDPASDAYRAAARRSDLFGLLTLVIVFVIVALMVMKPALWQVAPAMNL
jgi:uncharacterized membrane protein